MLRLKRFQEQLCGRQRTEIQLAASEEIQISKHEPIPTVLIVEDNDKDALLLSKQLEYEPYIVNRVSDANWLI